MGGFAARAQVVTGPVPATSALPYVVRVQGGRLRLDRADTGGPVLDVPLDLVSVRRLGRAGAVVVEVDEAPVLVDFTVRDSTVAGRLGAMRRRVLRAVRARGVRRRFLAAARRPVRES